MSTVNLKSVYKSYGSVRAIHGIDLSIADGEFVALVGPSGCGKSTLLRMIAGLEPITTGDIYIDDKLVNDFDPRSRNVAMVFQNYALYPHMSVRENISLNLKLSRVSKTEIEQRVNAAAELLDIIPILDRQPGQLSGGQRQRVAMGRALVRDPSVFLFDEPLSNLDAKLRVQMRSEIKAFHKNAATTSVYVTHDQIEAMTLADRAVVLNEGKIEQEGAPMDLYNKPNNSFVAGFIGSPAMNFFSGQLASGEDRQHTARMTDSIMLKLPETYAAQVGSDIIVGIRPEHFVVSANSGELTANVLHVEATGAQTLLSAECLGQETTVVVNEQVPLVAGERIGLSVLPGKLHVFDKTTGQRIESDSQGSL